MRKKSLLFFGLDFFGITFIGSFFSYNTINKFKRGCIIPLIIGDIFISFPCCASRENADLNLF